MKRIMKPRSPSRLGYALLGLIQIEPRSGYDLRKLFETTPMGHYSSSPGAIYPALKRLEEQELIIGEIADGDTLRPRRVYSATRSGTETLRAWVSQDVVRDDLLRRDDELMLRFALMGSVVDSRTTRRFLEQMLAILDTYLPELESVLAALPTQGPPHGRLALAAGIASYKARRGWLQSAIREFPNRSAAEGRSGGWGPSSRS
jgi:DNA-binding PadR family transcriptional regulator